MLDPQGRKDIAKVVKKLNKEEKVTIIAITHYMEEVIGADKVYVLNNGEVALSGTPEEIFSKRKILKSFGLEIPLAAYIAEKLKEQGLNIKDGILTDQQLAEALCEL